MSKVIKYGGKLFTLKQGVGLICSKCCFWIDFACSCPDSLLFYPCFSVGKVYVEIKTNRIIFIDKDFRLLKKISKAA